VENQEPLDAGATVGDLSNSIESEINELLSNGVMTTSVVVGGVFFPSEKLVWAEEFPVGTAPHFVNDGGLQIDKDGPWDVLSSTVLGEEGIDFLSRGVVWHQSVRGDAVFKAVEFPARVSKLDSGLADVDANDLSHFFGR